MDYLGLKDSSRQLRANCAISYSFYLHLMLHACATRFDVTGNLENFWILGGIQSLRRNAVLLIDHHLDIADGVSVVQL